MRIGELAGRTEIPARMLRYYEEQELLTSGRQENGYRDYQDSAVERAGQIRQLFDAGLPSRIIRDVLPCLDRLQEPGGSCGVDKATLSNVHQLLIEMEARIKTLIRNRDAITAFVRMADATVALPCAGAVPHGSPTTAHMSATRV